MSEAGSISWHNLLLIIHPYCFIDIHRLIRDLDRMPLLHMPEKERRLHLMQQI